jgi:hypothetical protein
MTVGSMDDGYARYVFEYRHDGSDSRIEIVAKSPQDARERLKAIRTCRRSRSEYSGATQIRCPLGSFAAQSARGDRTDIASSHHRTFNSDDLQPVRYGRAPGRHRKTTSPPSHHRLSWPGPVSYPEATCMDTEQLTLFGAAIIVLLIFAWSYVYP